MFKNIFLILSCTVSFAICAVESTEDSKALHRATDKYLNFINQISKGIDYSETDAAEIISPTCKKVLNGQLYTRSREEFLMDLRTVYEDHGAWEVYPADTIIDPISHTAVLRLFIEMKKLGAYTAIVILRYDSDYLITEINEVLSQVIGYYDFNS